MNQIINRFSSSTLFLFFFFFFSFYTMRGHLLLMLLCCAVASALASTKHHPIKYSTKRYATGKNSSSSKKLSYGSHRLITYIVDWDVPSTINWGKLDHVTYAFAEPNAEGKLESITSTNLKSGMLYIEK